MSDEAAIELVYHEARLLDEKRFEEWYELLTPDALYWMPLSREQPPGEAHTSLFYEDRLLLQVRIERLRHPHAFSQHQPSFCQHVLQRPSVEAGAHSQVKVLRTPFIYLESKLDQQLVLAGTFWHHLVVGQQGWRIRMKKIELLNRDAALPSIELLL
jgi:3-phenylpropionate/cinnamic acid dioxygenase small subunit